MKGNIGVIKRQDAKIFTSENKSTVDYGAIGNSIDCATVMVNGEYPGGG